MREISRQSQKDIFKSVGLSSGALSLMEAGKSGIQANTLFSIADKIGFHPGMFFFKHNLSSDELEKQTNDFLLLVEGESFDQPEIKALFRHIFMLMENIKSERKRMIRTERQMQSALAASGPEGQ